MADTQQQHYDDGPEVALQTYPEVIPPLPSQSPSHAYSLSTTQPPGSAGGGYPSPSYAASKPEDGYITAATASAVGVNNVGLGMGAGAGPGSVGGTGIDPRFNQQYHPHYYNQLASQDNTADGTPSDNNDAANKGGGGKWSGRQGPFGCTVLVFVLSIVIAILAATVVGLAAGTGVDAHRANQALASLASLQANPPQPTATSAATSFAAIDNNCSLQPDTVTGTMYTSFQLLGQQTFTIHCNKDAQGAPLMSLFTADFNTCMDACSGYSKALHKTFNVTNSNTTCGGVSFIPLWTNKKNATSGKAPGNCYLKPTPQNASTLPTPSISTEVHAAILS